MKLIIVSTFEKLLDRDDPQMAFIGNLLAIYSLVFSFTIILIAVDLPRQFNAYASNASILLGIDAPTDDDIISTSLNQPISTRIQRTVTQLDQSTIKADANSALSNHYANTSENTVKSVSDTVNSQIYEQSREQNITNIGSEKRRIGDEFEDANIHDETEFIASAIISSTNSNEKMVSNIRGQLASNIVLVDTPKNNSNVNLIGVGNVSNTTRILNSQEKVIDTNNTSQSSSSSQQVPESAFSDGGVNNNLGPGPRRLVTNTINDSRKCPPLDIFVSSQRKAAAASIQKTRGCKI